MNHRITKIILLLCLTCVVVQVRAQMFKTIKAPQTNQEYTTASQTFLKIAKPEFTSGWINYEIDGLKRNLQISGNKQVLLVFSRNATQDIVLEKLSNGSYYRHLEYPYMGAKTYSFLEINDKNLGVDTVLSIAVSATNGQYTLDTMPLTALEKWGFKDNNQILDNSLAVFLLNPYGYRDTIHSERFVNDINLPNVADLEYTKYHFTTNVQDVSEKVNLVNNLSVERVLDRSNVLSLSIPLQKPYNALNEEFYKDFLKLEGNKLTMVKDLDSITIKFFGTVFSSEDNNFILTDKVASSDCVDSDKNICVYPDIRLIKQGRTTPSNFLTENLTVKHPPLTSKKIEYKPSDMVHVQNVEYVATLRNLKAKDSVILALNIARTQFIDSYETRMGVVFQTRKLNYGSLDKAILNTINKRKLNYGNDLGLTPKTGFVVEKIYSKEDKLTIDHNLFVGSRYAEETLVDAINKGKEVVTLIAPSMQPVHLQNFLIEKDFVDTLNIELQDGIVENRYVQNFGWSKAFTINTMSPKGEPWLLPNIEMNQSLVVRAKSASDYTIETSSKDLKIGVYTLKNLKDKTDANKTVGYRLDRFDFNSLAQGNTDDIYLIPPKFPKFMSNRTDYTKGGFNSLELFEKNREFVYELNLGLKFDNTYYGQNIHKKFYPTNSYTGRFKDIYDLMKTRTNSNPREIKIGFDFSTIGDRYFKKDLAVKFKQTLSEYRPKVAYGKEIKEYFKGLKYKSTTRELTTEKEIIEHLGLALFKNISPDGVKGYDSIYFSKPLQRIKKKTISNLLNNKTYYIYADTLGNQEVEYIPLSYINDSLFFPDKINDGALFFSGFFNKGSNYTVLPTHINLGAINNDGIYGLRTTWNNYSDNDTVVQSPYFAYNFFKTLTDSTTFQLAVPNNDLVTVTSSSDNWFKMKYRHDADVTSNASFGYAIFFNDTISRTSSNNPVLMIDEKRIENGLFIQKENYEYAYVNLDAKLDVEKAEIRSIPALAFKLKFDDTKANEWTIDTLPERLIYEAGLINKNLQNPAIIKEFDSLSVAFFVPSKTATDYPRKRSEISSVSNATYSLGSLFASQFDIATLPKVPFADLKKIDYKTNDFVDTIHHANFEEYIKPITGAKNQQMNFLERYRFNPRKMFSLDTSLYLLISNIDNLDIAQEQSNTKWNRDTLYKPSLSKADESTYPMLVKISNPAKDTTIYSIEYSRKDFPKLQDHNASEKVSLIHTTNLRDKGIWEHYFTQIFHIEQWTNSKSKDVRLKVAYQFADTLGFKLHRAADTTSLSMAVYPYYSSVKNATINALKTKFKRPVIFDSFWIPNPYRYDNDQFMKLSLPDEKTNTLITAVPDRTYRLKSPDATLSNKTFKESPLFLLEVNSDLFEFNLDKSKNNFKLLVHRELDSLPVKVTNTYFKARKEKTLLDDTYPLTYLFSQVDDVTITTKYGTELKGARSFSLERKTNNPQDIPYLTSSLDKSTDVNHNKISVPYEYLELLPDYNEPDTIAFQLFLDSTYNGNLFYNQATVLKLKKTVDNTKFSDSIVVSPAFYQHVLNTTTVKFDIEENPITDPEELFSFDVPSNPKAQDFWKWIPYKFNKNNKYDALTISDQDRKLMVMVADRPYTEWPLISLDLEKAYDGVDKLFFAKAFLKNALGEYESNKFDTVMLVDIPFSSDSKWLMDSLPISALKHIKMFDTDTFYLSIINPSMDVHINQDLTNSGTPYDSKFKIYHPNHLRKIQGKPGRWKVPFLKGADVLDSLRIEPFSSNSISTVATDTFGIHPIHFGQLKYKKVNPSKDIILNVAISNKELAKPSNIDSIHKVSNANAWVSHYELSTNKQNTFLDVDTDFIRRRIRLKGSESKNGDTGSVFLRTSDMRDYLMMYGSQSKESTKVNLPLHIYMQSLENVTFFEPKDINVNRYSIGDFGGFFSTLRTERYKKVKTKEYVHSLQPMDKIKGKYQGNRLDSMFRFAFGIPNKPEIYLAANPSNFFYINQNGVVNTSGNTSVLKTIDLNTNKTDTVELYMTESNINPTDMQGTFLQTASLPSATLLSYFSTTNSAYKKFKTSADGILTEYSSIDDKMVVKFTVPLANIESKLRGKTRTNLASLSNALVSMIDDNSEVDVFDSITKDIVFTLSMREKTYNDMMVENSLDGQYILPFATQSAMTNNVNYTSLTDKAFISKFMVNVNEFNGGVPSAYIFRAYTKPSVEHKDYNILFQFDKNNISDNYLSQGDTTLNILPFKADKTAKVYSDIAYEDPANQKLVTKDSVYIIMSKFDIKKHANSQDIFYDSILPIPHSTFNGVNWKLGVFKSQNKDTILFKKVSIFGKSSSSKITVEPLLTAHDFDVIAQSTVMSNADQKVYIYLSNGQDYRTYYPSVNKTLLYKKGATAEMSSEKEFGSRQFLFNYYLNNPMVYTLKDYVNDNTKMFQLDLSSGLIGNKSSDGLTFDLFKAKINSGSLVEYIPYADANNQDSTQIIFSPKRMYATAFNDHYFELINRGTTAEEHVDTLTVRNRKTSENIKAIAIKVKVSNKAETNQYLMSQKSSILTQTVEILHGEKGKLYIYLYDKNKRLIPSRSKDELPIVFPIQSHFIGKKKSG